MNKMFWFWFIVISLLGALCIFSGCEEEMTKAQWDAQYCPVDVNAANAKVVLEKGLAMAHEAVAAQKFIDYVRLVCVVGCVASIAAIILGTSTMSALGWSGLVICLASIALIQFYTTWPLWFALGGGTIDVAAGLYAIYQHRTALTEVVTNIEGIKNSLPVANKYGPVNANDSIQNELSNQSPSTKSLVSSIKANL